MRTNQRTVCVNLPNTLYLWVYTVHFRAKQTLRNFKALEDEEDNKQNSVFKAFIQ